MLAIVGGLGASVGCLLPWYTGGGYIETGVEFFEGVIILILGIIIAALAIFSMLSGTRWPRVAALLPAVGSLVLVIPVVIDIGRAAVEYELNPMEFVGWGVVIVLVGSLLAVGGTSRSLRRR